MSSNVKNVLYGAMQKYVLTPNVGYEVDSVEVLNKTSGEIVPSQLEKTSENPPQWTLSFQQPAGMISVRPKMKPMMFTVVIEECENCNIVLLEYDEAVNIQVGSALNSGNNGQKAEGGANFNLPQHSADSEENTESFMNVGGNDSANHKADIREHEDVCEGGAEVEPCQKQSETTLTKTPGASRAKPKSSKKSAVSPVEQTPEPEVGDISQDKNTGKISEDQVKNGESGEEESSVPAEDVGVKKEDCADQNDTEVTEEAEEPEHSHDVVYDPGDFADELEEVEPQYITAKEKEAKCDLYWDYSKAYHEGRISKEKFHEVYMKHTQFLDDIRDGRIVVREANGESSANS